jgi:hypothetical protein
MNILKKTFLNFIVKHLFKGFVADDIISYNRDKNEFSVAGNIMSDSDVDNIMKTLHLLDQNDGYNALLRDVEYRAEEMLFLKSKTEDDMIFAKSSLFIIDLLRKRKDQLLAQYEHYKKCKHIK